MFIAMTLSVANMLLFMKSLGCDHIAVRDYTNIHGCRIHAEIYYTDSFIYDRK